VGIGRAAPWVRERSGADGASSRYRAFTSRRTSRSGESHGGTGLDLTPAHTMTDRILVFIPCYNCERQIGRVLRQFRAIPAGTFAEILVVDNRSRDRTASVATQGLSSAG